MYIRELMKDENEKEKYEFFDAIKYILSLHGLKFNQIAVVDYYTEKGYDYIKIILRGTERRKDETLSIVLGDFDMKFLSRDKKDIDAYAINRDYFRYRFMQNIKDEVYFLDRAKNYFMYNNDDYVSNLKERHKLHFEKNVAAYCKDVVKDITLSNVFQLLEFYKLFNAKHLAYNPNCCYIFPRDIYEEDVKSYFNKNLNKETNTIITTHILNTIKNATGHNDDVSKALYKSKVLDVMDEIVLDELDDEMFKIYLSKLILERYDMLRASKEIDKKINNNERIYEMYFPHLNDRIEYKRGPKYAVSQINSGLTKCNKKIFQIANIKGHADDIEDFDCQAYIISHGQDVKDYKKIIKIYEETLDYINKYFYNIDLDKYMSKLQKDFYGNNEATLQDIKTNNKEK